MENKFKCLIDVQVDDILLFFTAKYDHIVIFHTLLNLLLLLCYGNLPIFHGG
ncbi:conserved hypothetical protein [Xenorhabdus bovienii str. oregonense]|uniref:Uncharacterized protein n=1 Tax=Xenorhabdus bovienii str. oregonense TaxID=1398202 RepID=A0A077PD41_XENBV|nr:conserved hypothetical protein [Xenorhabdus bovienii str. oregonense]